MNARVQRVAAGWMLLWLLGPSFALGCGDDGGGERGLPTGRRDAGQDSGGPGPTDSSVPPPPPPEDAGRRDTGTPPPGMDARVVPPEEDAGTPSCRRVDCSSFDSECTVGVCDETTFECHAVPIADGTACGSQALNTCTAPDRCEAGVCIPRHTPSGTACGDQNVVCHVNDTCDGNGNCVDNGLAAAGTACGDATPSDPQCDAADSCNAAGVCVQNRAPADTPCGDPGGLCRFADLCDGLGECQDGGNWTTGSCPAGVPQTVAGDCICGRANVGSCQPVPDICVAGDCVIGRLPDNTPCGNQSPTHPVCDNPDRCIDGYCDARGVTAGTPCGDTTTNTTCNRPDSCDGSGNCDPGHPGPATLCGSPAVCMAAPACNGAGQCGAAVPLAPGTLCGSSSDTECDNPDTCDGSGTCALNRELSGAPCGTQGVTCMFDDACNGSGVCVDNGPRPPGTPCGNGSDSECNHPDQCDGSGTCDPSFEPQGTVCGGPQGMCFLDDTCTDSGVCEDNGFMSSGCDLTVTGTVTTLSGSPLAGVGVSIERGAPAQSTVSDANGLFSITVEVGVEVLVHFAASTGRWGSLLAYRGDPTQTSMGTVRLADDAFVETFVDAPGIDPVDTAFGMVAFFFHSQSGAGGEAATVTPTCAASSCGPVAQSSGGPVVSAVLLPGTGNSLVYPNLALGDFTVAATGATGLSDCTLRHGATRPTLAHTVTTVDVDCTPP